MPNPWVSLRCDQLIPVNKAVNKKEQLKKRAGGGKKVASWLYTPVGRSRWSEG
jgi:hypothetical protein